MKLLLPFTVALFAALASIPLIRMVAARVGFVDRPAARKLHVSPMPLGGGFGLILGLVLGTLAARPSALEPRFVLAWVAGLLLIALVGLVDDRAALNPLAKLAGQLVAALVLVLGSGHPDPSALGGWAVPVAIVGVVGLMNACNFLDNMDGILGGIAVLSAAGFALVARGSSPEGVAPAAAALAGAAAGFLAYNFSPARIFMGDLGSLAIGYALAALWLALTPASPPMLPALGLVLIVGYPLFDLAFVTITRLGDGRRPWWPGKDHSTHRLNRILGNPRRTAIVVYALTGLLVAAGVTVAYRPRPEILLAAALGVLLFIGLGLRLARVPAA
jgi:UDP-GlcNAc:undecaprenyl-phosphate/decaprenyl-phosphate GlcNAc-1-phosphate transferase